jgi:hypothetical protein
MFEVKSKPTQQAPARPNHSREALARPQQHIVDAMAIYFEVKLI